MNCPYCVGESKVVDSRPISDGIRRRRECLACGRRFTTQERVVSAEIKIIKSRGRPIEEFRTEKLRTSIERVSKGRPIRRSQIEAAVRTIEASLVDSGKSTINSFEIAKMVLLQLAGIDDQAYARFAANYIGHDRGEEARVGTRTGTAKQYNLFDK